MGDRFSLEDRTDRALYGVALSEDGGSPTGGSPFGVRGDSISPHNPRSLRDRLSVRHHPV